MRARVTRPFYRAKFDLLRVRAGVRRVPAIDAIGAVGKPVE
jgi:hypothetical protein